MDIVGNYTEAWQSTIDHLKADLDAARDIPPWAIAVITMCAVSLLLALFACGFGLGILAQSSTGAQKNRHETNQSLLNADSAAQRLNEQTGRASDLEMQPSPVAHRSSTKKGKRRVVEEDEQYDPEL
jgi:hypothetical protein